MEHPPSSSAFADPAADIASLRQRLDEAARLMSAYRVKAHALDRELDATRERLSKSRASHKKIIAERDQTIAGLQVAINEMHIRAVDAEAGFPCVNERDTTITSLRDSLVAANAHAAKLEREAHKDRASIVAFLAAEAKRRDKEARSRIMSPDTQDQLRDEAVLCRTLELAIERGDDLRSGECITIDDIPAADLVSIDAIGCVVGDMFTGFKQSIEAPSKTGIAIALHLGGWRVGMSVEEAHAIIARSGILLYEVTPIARATGGGE